MQVVEIISIIQIIIVANVLYCFPHSNQVQPRIPNTQILQNLMIQGNLFRDRNQERNWWNEKLMLQTRHSHHGGNHGNQNWFQGCYCCSKSGPSWMWILPWWRIFPSHLQGNIDRMHVDVHVWVRVLFVSTEPSKVRCDQRHKPNFIFISETHVPMFALVALVDSANFPPFPRFLSRHFEFLNSRWKNVVTIAHAAKEKTTVFPHDAIHS